MHKCLISEPKVTKLNKLGRRVGLAQLVRFLVVELIYPGSNPKFNMSVIFTANYSFSGRRRLRRQ
jgi:hypothetical protein